MKSTTGKISRRLSSPIDWRPRHTTTLATPMPMSTVRRVSVLLLGGRIKSAISLLVTYSVGIRITNGTISIATGSCCGDVKTSKESTIAHSDANFITRDLRKDVIIRY